MKRSGSGVQQGLYALVAKWERRGLQNLYRVGSIPTQCSNLGMPMAKSNRHAGQFDLRGKKTLRLRCKCCTVEDFRDKLNTKEVKKYLRSTEVVARLS